jgi:hypothetical protein
MGHRELALRTIVGGNNIVVRVGPSNQIEILSDSFTREYSYDCTLDIWEDNKPIVLPPHQHGLGNGDHFIVAISERVGNDVVTNINGSEEGWPPHQRMPPSQAR